MHALIISEKFPPLNRVSSDRAYSFARALSRAGCDVSVLTSRKTPAHGDLSLDYDFEGLEMLEVASPDPPAARRSRWTWTWRAASALRGLMRDRRFELIISSHGPSSSHVLGSIACRLGKDAFWVADYRDPWTTSQYGRPRSIMDPLKKAVERRLVSSAHLITTVSRGFASNISGLVPDLPIRVVPNGFQRAGSAATRGAAPTKPRLLTHTGTIYPKKAGVLRTFFAVVAVLQEKGLSPGSLRVAFAGTNLDIAGRLAREHGVESFVSFLGLLPRSEAHALQDRCDALLLLEDGDAARSGVITAKIYEYVASGRPILVIGPDDGTEIGELIRETSTGVCLGENPAAIEDALATVVAGDAQTLAAPRSAAIARYSRTRIAQDFLELLKSVGVPLPSRAVEEAPP